MAGWQALALGVGVSKGCFEDAGYLVGAGGFMKPLLALLLLIVPRLFLMTTGEVDILLGPSEEFAGRLIWISLRAQRPC